MSVAQPLNSLPRAYWSDKLFSYLETHNPSRADDEFVNVLLDRFERTVGWQTMFETIAAKYPDFALDSEPQLPRDHWADRVMRY